MEFMNNLNSVAGITALKALTAKNNVTSTLYGSMLIYGDTGLDSTCNDSPVMSSIRGACQAGDSTGQFEGGLLSRNRRRLAQRCRRRREEQREKAGYRRGHAAGRSANPH